MSAPNIPCQYRTFPRTLRVQYGVCQYGIAWEARRECGSTCGQAHHAIFQRFGAKRRERLHKPGTNTPRYQYQPPCPVLVRMPAHVQARTRITSTTRAHQYWYS
eukprot:3783246-Rhodomonas_salina.2